MTARPPPTASTAGDIARRVVEHLLEIGTGTCSITPEMLAATESDSAMGEILTGLLYLHQDLQLRERQRLEAEAEAKQATELRHAKEMAEASTAAKSQFLAHMSHEIRTPLTALLGFTDLMLEPGVSESSRLNYGLIVKRNGEHLLSLINDILDLSRIEAGKLGVERVPTQLAQLLSEVVSLMRVRAVERGLEFELRLLSPIPTVIHCDPTRLRQVLLNLVGNAVKFTDKGSVRIFTRYQERSRPPTLLIDVIDTGIGMTAEHLERLFRPFQQADASMTRRFGGSGLGLAICKALAAALDGEITAQSAPGEGSTFTLTLAIEVPPGTQMTRTIVEAAPDLALVEPRGLGLQLHGSVLLAEDGPDNQLLLTTILRQYGLTVVVAENGRIAVERAQAAKGAGRSFDLILMDMQMPELDGYGATRQLRHEGYRDPIVALSAHAMAGERERCLVAGCDDYLSKPVDRLALLATVQRYLHRKAPVAAPKAPLRSTMRDEREMADLITRFVNNMPARITSLRAAASQHDMAALVDQVHQLKGAAGGYGFAIITQVAARLEQALRPLEREQPGAAAAALTGPTSALLDELIDLCERVSV
jgi:signal transduction histidine kinase/DNA-binding response OmpR family regulator